MLKNKTLVLFYVLSILFMLGGIYVLFKFKSFYIPYCISPILLAVVLTALLSPEKLVFIVVFFTPLAVTLRELGVSGNKDLDLSLPTEPLMAGLLLITIFQQVLTGFIEKKILRHPITVIIGIQLAWIAITGITSEMPLVSFKFLVARLWFVCTSFYLCSYLFKKEENIFRYLLLSIIPLSIVIVYTLINHAAIGFDEEASDWIVSPFYNDHTAYSAAMAMFVPVICGFIFQKKYPAWINGIFVFLLLLFLTGIFFSYARAAIVSLGAALAILGALLLKIKFRTLLVSLLVLGGLFFVFQTQILILLSDNKTDSEGDFTANLQSISNIKTDASNLERINRWSCAIRMFEEKPVFGWGPGTYMFEYAPFQKKSERSYISINDGSNGNAHSEYLGPLSEQGLPGMLIMLALTLAVFFTGFRLCYTVKERHLKILTYSVLLGLTTYFTHGLMNNFLDTDKLSVPFWGFIAILVGIDVYHNKSRELN